MVSTCLKVGIIITNTGTKYIYLEQGNLGEVGISYTAITMIITVFASAIKYHLSLFQMITNNNRLSINRAYAANIKIYVT